MSMKGNRGRRTDREKLSEDACALCEYTIWICIVPADGPAALSGWGGGAWFDDVRRIFKWIWICIPLTHTDQYISVSVPRWQARASVWEAEEIKKKRDRFTAFFLPQFLFLSWVTNPNCSKQLGVVGLKRHSSGFIAWKCLEGCAPRNKTHELKWLKGRDALSDIQAHLLKFFLSTQASLTYLPLFNVEKWREG